MKTLVGPIFCNDCGAKIYRNVFDLVVFENSEPKHLHLCNACMKERYMYKVVEKEKGEQCNEV